MDFIRPINWDAAHASFEGGYKGQFLYCGESCAIIATFVPPGVGGPPNHRHSYSDQCYLVVDGEITIKLGSEIKKAPRHSLIFIPSGVPHHNWNEGSEPDIHIEVIAPNVLPTQPIVDFADDDDARGLPYYVKQYDATTAVEPIPGFKQGWLANRDSGAVHAGIYIAEMAPSGAGPQLHIHDFDQFYFVLEGTLNVQIGFDEHAVGPNTLVVLPAGVPHRQWNASAEPELHAAILVPEPPFKPHEAPWDVGVVYEKGEPVG